jgi:hypothetical protein
MACGHFSDIGFVSAGKKRGFCRLRRLGQRKSDRLLAPPAQLKTTAERIESGDG